MIMNVILEIQAFKSYDSTRSHNSYTWGKNMYMFQKSRHSDQNFNYNVRNSQLSPSLSEKNHQQIQQLLGNEKQYLALAN